MLELQRFLIRKRVPFLKRVDTYDILDADTRQAVGVAREQPGFLVRLLRWFISRELMPTRLAVFETEDESLVFSVHRSNGLWRRKAEVYDAEHCLIGYFKSRILTWGKNFRMYNPRDEPFAEVRGDWTGFRFKFVTPDGRELGIVTNQWAGLAKELFTSADDYLVAIHKDLADLPFAKMLLLAAALVIDMVYEKKKVE
jgi:hypothetical protein